MMKFIMLRLVAAVVLTFATSSCGFHIRGAVNLPAEMKNLWIQGIARNSQLTTNLENTLRFSGGAISADRNSASSILNVLDEKIERREISLSNTGKANEFQLTYTLIYELLDLDGNVILPRDAIEIIRDYFNQQVQVIGKSIEESQIRSNIYKDAARTLLRRTSIALKHS